jgi:outer membrane receptor protein involved in Fe transport
MPLASALMVAIPGAFAQQATETAGLEEIIVTAQKRTEDLQAVPLSIAAFDTQKLEELKVQDFEDYVKYLPNVSYQQLGPGFARIFMRGVSSGDNGNHSGPLPSVGMYLDEQPITTIQGPLDIHIYDVARVETLAGPQGTLYGASSQAGTIRIITNKPDPAEFAAGYGIEGNSVHDGDFGGVLEGFVNMPLNPNMAIRLVGWYQHDAGYIDNVAGSRTFPGMEVLSPGNATFNNAGFPEDDFNEVDTYGGRASLRVDLNDNWTMTPTVMAQEVKADGIFAYDPQQGDFNVSHYYPDDSEDRFWQAALTEEGKIGQFDVVYAGGYLDRNDETDLDYSDYSLFYDALYASYDYDGDGFPAYSDPDGGDIFHADYFRDDAGNLVNPSQYIQGRDAYNMWSHELRLSSPADWRWRFVTGVYYQRQVHDIEQRYLVNDLTTTLEVTGWPDTFWLTEQERTNRDFAIFGETSYDITEDLTATVGARWFKARNALTGFFGFNDDYSSQSGEARCISPPDPVPGGGLQGGPCVNLDKEVTEYDWTPKVSLAYRFDPDRMVYATYAEGFRPPGVNRRDVSEGQSFPPYKSDFLDSYEIGWKTTWLDNTLRVNGALFLQKWDDFQFSFLGENGLTNVTNAGKAEISGVELDLQWAGTENLTVSASMMQLFSPELKEDFCETLDLSGNQRPPPGTTGDPDIDCDPTAFAPDGTQLPLTPEFKANLIGRYRFTVGSYDSYVQGAVVYHGDARSALLPDDERLLDGELDAYTIVDLSAGIEKNNWTAELIISNAFDEEAELGRFTQCDEGICGADYVVNGVAYNGIVYEGVNQPRTIGLRFSQKFGSGV